MKQKKQNRILAALLAVVMMFQMLPMMAFADEGAGSEGAPSDVTLRRTGKSYSDLQEAVKAAESGDTIELGVGDYTLYKVDSTDTTKGKNLTFVGQGTDKTTWYIGAYVTDPNKTGEYTGDYCFDGAGTVTFEDMTLRAGPAKDPNAKIGFIRPDNTVVNNCEIVGWTAFWEWNSAEFTNTTFKPSLFKDAIWVYSSKEATFNNCTFTAGRGVKVYTEDSEKSVTVNFNDCTVENSGSYPAIYIDEYVLDRDCSKERYNINITGSNHVKAQTNTYTCSKLFGFKRRDKDPGYFTNVKIDGELVWSEGEMKTHDYTDGEKDNAYTIDPVSEWENKGDHFERKVTKTCNYCKRQFPNVTEKGYQLSYDLNDGTGAAGVDYESKIYPEGEKATVAAAPALNGYRFVAWQDEADNRYPVGMELTLTANTTLTALWESVDKPEPDPGPGPSPDPDPEPGDDGSGAVIGVVIGGAAVIGGYELATRLYLKHLIGVVPSTRGELALLMWEHADKPEPKTAFTYSDIDEDDTDLQKAAQWCVENEYLHVRDNDNDRFHPNGWVPKLKVIQAWDKAFGLQAKANADK